MKEIITNWWNSVKEVTKSACAKIWAMLKAAYATVAKLFKKEEEEVKEEPKKRRRRKK